MSSYNIYSWNVNGIRAVTRKGALQEFVAAKSPDILCIQETKAKQEQAQLCLQGLEPDQDSINIPGYQAIWNSAKRPGYSGTAIFTKTTPLQSFTGFTDDINISYPWHEDNYGDPLSEGRVLTAEYPEFFLVTVYTPNSKPDLSRLKLRELLWDPAFLRFLQELEKEKPVVVCGDFNAAHTAIDLARPKENEKNAGYTEEERQGITNLINADFIDTFRLLHPDEKKYTWWSFRAGARAKNIGWRIDYFFVSKALEKNLKSAEIHNDITGSDHCPVSICLEF